MVRPRRKRYTINPPGSNSKKTADHNGKCGYCRIGVLVICKLYRKQDPRIEIRIIPCQPRQMYHRPKVLDVAKYEEDGNRLPAIDFIRVHRSFIVALHKIDTIEENMVRIKNEMIPIGELYKTAFLERVNGLSLL